MKFAHIDSENNILGWYDNSIHSNIPKPNILVSDKNWLIAINKNANKIYSDGTSENIKQITECIEYEEINQIINKEKLFLKNTNWYYFRFLEENIPIPEDIIQKRIQSRKIIEQYNQYNQYEKDKSK